MQDVFQTLPTTELYVLMEMHTKIIQQLLQVITDRDSCSVDWDYTADLPRNMANTQDM